MPQEFSHTQRSHALDSFQVLGPRMNSSGQQLPWEPAGRRAPEPASWVLTEKGLCFPTPGFDLGLSGVPSLTSSSADIP